MQEENREYKTKLNEMQVKLKQNDNLKATTSNLKNEAWMLKNIIKTKDEKQSSANEQRKNQRRWMKSLQCKKMDF